MGFGRDERFSVGVSHLGSRVECNAVLNGSAKYADRGLESASVSGGVHGRAVLIGESMAMQRFRVRRVIVQPCAQRRGEVFLEWRTKTGHVVDATRLDSCLDGLATVAESVSGDVPRGVPSTQRRWVGDAGRG